MPGILLLQPSYAHYREPLFSLLWREHHVRILYERSKSTYPGTQRSDTVPSRTIDTRFSNVPAGLAYYLLNERPDLVITSAATAYRSMIAYLYARTFRKKIVLWILEWRPLDRPGGGLRGALQRLRRDAGNRILRGADAVVVGGTAARRFVRSQGRKERDIFTAFQCAPDMGSFRMGPRIADRNPPPYTFLYLSRIVPYKGLDILIRAFSLLRRERSDVRLLVAGDGPFRRSCEELARSLGTPDIAFLGAVDPADAPRVYSRSDVFVLPSCFRERRYETWGLVINEAMSMGLPVLTTSAVGAAFDLVVDGCNGFVVPAGSVENLHEAMRRILDMDLRKMGRESRRIFEEKNRYPEMADGFSRAIRHVRMLSRDMRGNRG